MQMKPKSNSVVTHTVSPEGYITFAVVGAGSFTINPADISAPNVARFQRHGIIQRISDAAAKGRDPNTGKSATPQARHDAMKRLADHYISGSVEWSPARAEGSGGLDQIILAAVVEATGKTHEEVRAMVAAGAEKNSLTPKAFLAALGTSKLVKPIVDRIRGEQVPEVDGDDLLAGMMTEGGDDETTE
jgi:hypothetical protein